MMLGEGGLSAMDHCLTGGVGTETASWTWKIR